MKTYLILLVLVFTGCSYFGSDIAPQGFEQAESDAAERISRLANI